MPYNLDFEHLKPKCIFSFPGSVVVRSPILLFRQEVGVRALYSSKVQATLQEGQGTYLNTKLKTNFSSIKIIISDSETERLEIK